jgi:hypothetical protein
MPKEPQLFEGSQSLWEYGWLGQGEESGSCRFESTIIERNWDTLSRSLKGNRWHIEYSPFVMLCTLLFASKRVISVGVVVRGRPASRT